MKRITQFFAILAAVGISFLLFGWNSADQTFSVDSVYTVSGLVRAELAGFDYLKDGVKVRLHLYDITPNMPDGTPPSQDAVRLFLVTLDGYQFNSPVSLKAYLLMTEGVKYTEVGMKEYQARIMSKLGLNSKTKVREMLDFLLNVVRQGNWTKWRLFVD